MDKVSKRILYLYSGDGSGEVYRGIALSKAVARANSGIEIDLAIHSSYQNLVEGLPNAILPTLIEYQQHYSQFFNRVLGQQSYDAVIIPSFFEQWQDLDLSKASNGATIKAYLLLYDIPNLETFLKSFKPESWLGIFLTEPTTNTQLAQKLGDLGIKTPLFELDLPVIATWPDEVISDKAQARRSIIKLCDGHEWEQVEGLPLVVVAQNGMFGELNQVKQEAIESLQTLFGSNHYTIRYMSQRRTALSHTSGHTKTSQLEVMMAGIDVLVAASGYNAFWGWQMYSHTGAEALWKPRPLTSRGIDDQISRAKSQSDPVQSLLIAETKKRLWAEGKTGADYVISQITKDLSINA